jgi:hypothetical protein
VAVSAIGLGTTGLAELLLAVLTGSVGWRETRWVQDDFVGDWSVTCWR